MSLHVVILAAGKGTRMHSALPKVLHKIAGKPMVQHVIDTAHSLKAEKIHLVYGHGGDQMKMAIKDESLNWVYQSEQLGTGHAVNQAMPFIPDEADVLVLYGDTPLIESETLKNLIAVHKENGFGLLTVDLDNPTGYGRILRKDNFVYGIVEQKDASDEQRKIQEVNTGVMLAPVYGMKRWLSALTNNNAQGEYYLTDVIHSAYVDGVTIGTTQPSCNKEVEGANDRLQLATLERFYQKRSAEKLMRQGVSLIDPTRFDLRGFLICGHDVEIDINVIIEGNVSLGHNVKIGAGCILKDCSIADNSVISPYSIIEQSDLKKFCTIGPFARIRPGSVLEDDVHVGNFVELKNAKLGTGTKAGHLSYLGDSKIGNNVNIGAGTITCNYDGANKHQTVIGNDVFVGSDTQLVAPVNVADGVTIGAGTTVTRDIQQNELVISRVEQKHIQGWKRPIKNKK